MHIVRVYDPERRPANWADIIRPEQFVAFARDLESGVPCDAEGRAFPDPALVTCILFDSLGDARAFCEHAVTAAPPVRFDVFDGEGRINPPLLTVVHPARAAALDTHPRAARRRSLIGWSTVAAGVAIAVYAYLERYDIDVIYPGFMGISLILIGARLFWMNLAVRETERARETRVAAAFRSGGRPQ